MRRMVYFGAGAAAALWARRRVIRIMERYTPQSVRDSAMGRARRLGGDVKAAMTDGRAAMVARQRQLRGVDGDGAGGGPGDGPALHLVVPPDERSGG